MSFSRAQYEAAIDEINSGMDRLSEQVAQIAPTANAVLGRWFIPQFVKDAILWLAEEMLRLAQELWDRLVDLLKGVAAPVFMYLNAQDWQEVRALATSVASDTDPAALKAGRIWSGSAADAYKASVAGQPKAAARIGAIGDKTATALMVSAAAGLAFYVALGVIVVKFIAATIAAVAALGSVVLSWAGAALIVEEAAVNTGLIIAAVTTLTALLGAQANTMVTLQGEANDATAFPGGRWPDATSGLYSDGTVKDGDADWSLA